MPPTHDELAEYAQQSRTLQSQAHHREVQAARMRSLRRRLSPEEIKALVTRYNAGETLRALAEEHGLSKNGLRQLLLAEGVSFRRQPMTPEDATRAVQLYEAGLTIKQVVGEVGYSYGTIRRVLHETGVAMRRDAIVAQSVSVD